MEMPRPLPLQLVQGPIVLVVVSGMCIVATRLVFFLVICDLPHSVVLSSKDRIRPKEMIDN